LVCSVYAVDFKPSQETKIKISPDKRPLPQTIHNLKVMYPTDGQICVINTGYSIIWLTNLIQNYGYVELELVWPDGTPAGGVYPVTNNGQYNWYPDASFWDESVRCKEYRVKVYTHDNKYHGLSGRFKIGQTYSKCP